MTLPTRNAKKFTSARVEDTAAAPRCVLRACVSSFFGARNRFLSLSRSAACSTRTHKTRVAPPSRKTETHARARGSREELVPLARALFFFSLFRRNTETRAPQRGEQSERERETQRAAEDAAGTVCERARARVRVRVQRAPPARAVPKDEEPVLAAECPRGARARGTPALLSHSHSRL